MRPEAEADGPSPSGRVRRGPMSGEGTLAAPLVVGTVDADDLVEALFHREGRSLVRLAAVFCDDREAAEDLVQEAFIRLHRSAGSIREPERAAAYLRSIVINLARDHNRRGLMSLRHRGRTPAPPRAPGFEDEVAAGTDDRVVIEALRLLPERQRACLVLRFYAQLTEVETARTLGISQSSVKTHCRRGLAALEAKLGEVER